MLVVLVVGGVLGWQARRWSLRRQAIAQVRAAGCAVVFDFQAPEGKSFRMGATPPGPRWLRRLVGDEPFQAAKWLLLNGRGPKGDEPTAATIAAIAALDRLQTLAVQDVPLTDDQLVRLARMPSLKVVDLRETRITPQSLGRLVLPRLESMTFEFDRDVPALAVLSALATHPRLKHLNLERLRAGGASDFAPLAALPLLEVLHVRESPADESCLDQVERLTRLKSLNIQSTRISDAGLRRLSGLGQLEDLIVDGSAVTDEGLADVARWPRLRALHLYGSTTKPGAAGFVTDRGLALLAAVGQLNHVSLLGSRITDEGLASLAQMPKLDYLELTGVCATDAGLSGLLTAHQFGNLALWGEGIADSSAALMVGQKGLENLTLDGARLTDAAMGHLTALPALRFLLLPGSHVTDAGLAKLAGSAARLDYIDLRGTSVTAAGVARFRQAKPNSTVQSGRSSRRTDPAQITVFGRRPARLIPFPCPAWKKA